MESIRAVRSDFAEMQITADTDLNSVEFRECVLGAPIIILRKFLKHPNCVEISGSNPSTSENGANQPVSNATFSFETLERVHGEQKITVLAQNADVSGFRLDQKNLWENMTLRSYLQYVKGLRQVLSAVVSVCVKKWTSHLDAAIECMEGHSDNKGGIADCGKTDLTGRTISSIKSEEPNLFDIKTADTTSIIKFKSSTSRSKGDADSKAGPISLRNVHLESYKQADEEGRTTDLIRQNFLKKSGEKRAICGAEKCGEAARSADEDTDDMKAVGVIAAACTLNESIPQKFLDPLIVRKNRKVSRNQLQLLLSLLCDGSEDCFGSASTEVGEERSKLKCPQWRSRKVHCGKVSSKMHTCHPRLDLTVVNGTYVSWIGITAIDFKKANQECAYQSCKNSEGEYSLTSARDIGEKQGAVLIVKSSNNDMKTFRGKPSATERESVMLNVIPDNSEKGVQLPMAENARVCAATAAATAAPATTTTVAPGTADTAPATADVDADADAVLECHTSSALKRGNSGDRDHVNGCSASDAFLKLRRNSDDMFKYWSESIVSPGGLQQHTASEHTYEHPAQTNCSKSFEYDSVSRRIFLEVSECDDSLPVDGTSAACPALLDRNGVLCQPSKSFSGERDARNKAYVASCAQKRTFQHSFQFESSAAIGCRKILKRSKPFKFGILSPGSVRKRKKLLENPHSQRASDMEFSTPTNLMKKRLCEHKHLMDNLRSICSPILTASCVIRWGNAYVTACFSELETVWSLSLMFHPNPSPCPSGDHHSYSCNLDASKIESRKNNHPCVLYSPLDKGALLSLLAEQSFSSSSTSLSARDNNLLSIGAPDNTERTDMQRILMMIVSTWPPLCSGRYQDSTALALDGVPTCDGVAMQAELFRLLKCCPAGVTGLLAGVLKASKKGFCPVITSLQGGSAIDTQCSDVSSSHLGQQDCDEPVQVILPSTNNSAAAYTAKQSQKSQAVTQLNGNIFLSYEQLQSAKLEGIARGRIKFCTNLDMSTWSEEMQSLSRCMPAWLMCRSSQDLLRFLRRQVEGMSTPQVYIKVPGVWTGGHEENLRFRSVNCTVGPGSSEWYAVEKEHTPRLRDLVMHVYGVDILGREGSWFISPQFLALHNIPFLHGVQDSDDIVVTRGDTLHWVRALGFSVHFSWNFGVFDVDQMEASMARYRQNEAITKKRNDRILNLNNIKEKKERNLREKVTHYNGKEAGNIQEKDNEATVNKCRLRKFVPSDVIAFQSLVPMQTLILDVVRELIRAAAAAPTYTVLPVIQSDSEGGSGDCSVTGSPRAVTASSASISSQPPVINQDAYSPMISNAGRYERQEMDMSDRQGEEERVVQDKGINADVIEADQLSSVSASASSIHTHMLSVLQNSCLLLTMLTELSVSIQELSSKLSIAQAATRMTAIQEPGGGEAAVHCGRKQCLMELFEVYVSCPKCGIICISCASGDGQVNKGGCIEPQYNVSRKRSSPASSTSSSHSHSRSVSSKIETECSGRMPHAGTSDMTKKKNDFDGRAGASERVEEEACEDDGKMHEGLLFGNDAAPAPKSTPSTPFSPVSSTTPSIVSGPSSSIRQSSPATIAKGPEWVTECSHVHSKGARLLLKSPLKALLALPRKFANVIVHLHPCQASHIQILEERFKWPND